MARILYITEIYPDPLHGLGVWGGGEKQFYEISRRIAKMGHQVSVLTCLFPGQAEFEDREGVSIYRVGLTRELRAGGARKSISPVSYVMKTGLRALALNPSLIHCNTYFPVFAGRIASYFSGVPVVATFHDVYGLKGWVESQGSLFWGLAGHIVSTSSAKLSLDRVISVSPQCSHKLERLGLRREKITVIPNGVDLKLFDSVPSHVVPGRILFVGRLVSFKHVDWLIEAFAKVLTRFPDASLKIVGGGPEMRRLQNLADTLRLGSRVTFTGVTPTYEAVVRYYKESEIFVLPSTVEGEAIVLKEAMAAYLPVVAMRVPGSGVLSLVRDKENGLLLRPGVPDSLAEALLDLLLNPERRKVMGENGRQFVEAYDWERIAERTMNLYQELIVEPR